MERYQIIVSLQGEEAKLPLELTDNPNADPLFTYLLQWDSSENEISGEQPWGKYDYLIFRRDLVLNYNYGKKIIGLCRVHDAEWLKREET